METAMWLIIGIMLYWFLGMICLVVEKKWGYPSRKISRLAPKADQAGVEEICTGAMKEGFTYVHFWAILPFMMLFFVIMMWGIKGVAYIVNQLRAPVSFVV